MRRAIRHIACWMSIMAMLMTVACSSEEWAWDDDSPLVGKDMLTMKPSIYQGDEAYQEGTTRVEDDDNVRKNDRVDARDELRENFIGTMDVFVKESTASDSAPWFHEYHLKAGESNVAENFSWIIDPDRYNGTSLKDQAEQLLHKSWPNADYDPTKKYNIYVTANNPHTVAESGDKPTNLSELKALKTYEYNIFRYFKNTQQEPDRRESYMRDEKQFLMDGSITNWQIDGTKEKQVFNVDLKRAVSKIIVRVRFNKDAMVTLTEEDIPDDKKYNAQTNPLGYRAGDQVKLFKFWDEIQDRVTGIPAWKYVNFGFKTSDIAGGDYQLSGNNLDDFSDSQKALQTWGSNFQVEYDGNHVTENMDNNFIITTYSYPIDWSASADKSPFILLSVAFTKRNDANDYKLSYYRIPVCDVRELNSIERNKIYIVDAEIGSLGSENSLLDMEDQRLLIEYHVLDWTAHDMSQEATVVKVGDTKYLTVTPTSYTLKGDDYQSVDLQWYASISTDDGRYLDIDNVNVTYTNYKNVVTNITGTVTKNPTTPDGTTDVTITSTAPTNTANGETVTLQLLKDGIIKVISQALDSRAMKTISFRVKLEGTNLTENVVIHHYPLDNINHIAGKWSSRLEANSGNVNVTVGTWDKAVADSWGVTYTTTTRTEYYTYAQYQADPTHITMEVEDESMTQSAWRAIVPHDDRQSAYSKENAYGPDSNGYIYWGTGDTTNGASNGNNNNDWSVSGWFNTTYHSYTAYHRARYSRTGTYYTGTISVPSTGRWVDWDRDNGQSYNAANAKYTYDGSNFIAKVYNKNDGKIYPIQVTRSGNNNNNYSYAYSMGTSQTSYYVYSTSGSYSSSSSSMANLNNPNMYVILITSASDEYAIGNPKLDSNFQSNDAVVSPAFMIASQLGANTPFDNGVNAATFCGTYIEVGSDDNAIAEFRGKRFTGWRLPTRDEVGFIAKYQKDPNVQDKNMQAVLTGDNYWTLEGKAVATGYNTTLSDWNTWYKQTNRDTNSGNVRCIRDLSLDEVKKLNGE